MTVRRDTPAEAKPNADGRYNTDGMWFQVRFPNGILCPVGMAGPGARGLTQNAADLVKAGVDTDTLKRIMADLKAAAKARKANTNG